MCENQNKPHVHAECIKAWADGAIIEHRGEITGRWNYCHSPSWNPNSNYRVQPVKKSPGQIAEEAFYKAWNMKSLWKNSSDEQKSPWEAAAQAVIDSLNQK